MKHSKRMLLAVLGCLVAPLAANADLPGRHPYYLHALSDLRSARWMLELRPASAVVSTEEAIAVEEVDRAIGEIKRAAVADGKNLAAHSAPDVPPDNAGRLHRALELLRKVHGDVAREEDDPNTRGLRDRAVTHIDAAIGATQQALAYIAPPH